MADFCERNSCHQYLVNTWALCVHLYHCFLHVKSYDSGLGDVPFRHRVEVGIPNLDISGPSLPAITGTDAGSNCGRYLLTVSQTLAKLPSISSVINRTWCMKFSD